MTLYESFKLFMSSVVKDVADDACISSGQQER